MRDYKPNTPFTVPLKLLIPTYKTVKGVRKKVIPEDGPLIWGSFKTYGGTERNENGAYSIEDTASVETYFRPDIKSDCLIRLAERKDVVYEIENTPEDINQRHKYCKFKVRRVIGGA